MKFSTIATLGGLLSVGLANHIQEVVCIDPAPVTITQTVTVTTGAGGGSQLTTAPYKPPYVTTAGSQVTSVDYSGSKTSVWVYPTGTGSKDCTVAIYEKETVTVVIINISVTIINGNPTTVTSTVTNAPPPTWTPTLPPQTSTTTTSAPPTGTGTIHSVIVGADGQLKYKDNQVIAAIGDIIRFDFNATNHTVTQSSFLEPCKPLTGGFNTGFNQFNKEGKTGIIFRDYKVEVSTPLWFFCAQGVHCKKGMVLGVNPGTKFPDFLSRATATATSSTVALTSVPSSSAVASGVAHPTGGAYVPATGTYNRPAIKARRGASFA
jgi:plastocyanin